MLSYRFRLYPSKTTERKLNHHMALCRWLYNRLLAELNLAREKEMKLKQTDTQTLIVDLKRNEKPELDEVYSKVLQMVNYQLWSNIRALAGLKRNGHKVGRLRFKGKGWFKTLNYNQSGFKIEGKKLVLSKIGEIPIKLHREIKGKIKGVIVKRERSGKWYAIFQVGAEAQPLPQTGKAVGIDVGARHFLTDSDGRQIENPRFYERMLERIRRLHRRLSKKRRGSASRRKAQIKLARAHEKLVSQRNDFLHKLSRFYVNNYDLIVIEKLNIRNMTRNSRLARRILDVSWGKFFSMLAYKAASAGRQLVEVDPRGTSRENEQIEDRDYRAALNMLARAAVGLGRPELTPVEMGPLRGPCEIPASPVVEAGSSMRQRGVVHSNCANLFGKKIPLGLEAGIWPLSARSAC
jgi:putative transposase